MDQPQFVTALERICSCLSELVRVAHWFNELRPQINSSLGKPNLVVNVRFFKAFWTISHRLPRYHCETGMHHRVIAE